MQKKCSSKGGSIMKKEQKHNDVLFLLKYLIPAILLFIALATFSLVICTYSSKNFSIEDKTTMLLVIFLVAMVHILRIYYCKTRSKPSPKGGGIFYENLKHNSKIFISISKCFFDRLVCFLQIFLHQIISQ